MDISSLSTFLAVARTGSFSQAGSELHVTQPAVSKRIAAVEEELGVALFDRIGRHVTLTEAGRTLLPRASRIVSEVRDCRRALSNLRGDVSGNLLIGTSHHIGLHRLPPVLSAFTRDHPDVDMDIRFLDSEVISDAVESGDLEIGIATLPAQPRGRISRMQVWTDILVVACNHRHPLAQVSSPEPDVLGRFPAVLPGPVTYTHRIIRQAMNGVGVELSVRLSTNYLETLKMLASVGFGWTILPTGMVDGGLVQVPIQGLHLHRDLGAVWHSGRTLSNAAEALLAELGTAADRAAGE